MEQHEVTLMGRRFRIRSESDQEHIEAVARYVDAKISEIAGGRGASAGQSAALLAALNVADELLRVRAEQSALREKIRHQSRALLDRLAPRP